MILVRTSSPYQPSSMFPNLKLAADNRTYETQADFDADKPNIANANQTIVDSGDPSTYHYDDVYWWVGPVPQGFHVEGPTVPFSVFDPRGYPAIVPDGKTRKDMGV